MTVGPEELDREKGNGSRDEGDDMYEAAAYRHDERANTETTFWLRDINNLEVSERRKKELRRALRRQEGENPGEAYYKDRGDRNQQNRGEWKRRMCSTYTSQLGLSPHQCRRVKHLVIDVLDFTEFASYNGEHCILAVVTYVAREDGRWIEEEEKFREFMKVEDVSKSDLRSIRGMIRERL